MKARSVRWTPTIPDERLSGSSGTRAGSSQPGVQEAADASRSRMCSEYNNIPKAEVYFALSLGSLVALLGSATVSRVRHIDS